MVHPQNVRFQNVRFQNVWNVRFTKRQVYKTSGLQNVGFTKCQVFRTSGWKKTYIYILYLWLVEIRRFCCSHVNRQSDGCVLFSILEGFLPYITIISKNDTLFTLNMNANLAIPLLLFNTYIKFKNQTFWNQTFWNRTFWNLTFWNLTFCGCTIFMEGPNNQTSTFVRTLIVFTIYLAAFRRRNSENCFEGQFRHVPGENQPVTEKL